MTLKSKNPNYKGRAPEPIKPRLEKFHIKTENDCWEWTSWKEHRGYGQISVNGKRRQAHRVAYEEYVGKIPSGIFVCHSCDNRACINPKHLWLGTAQDNTNDMMRKGRHWRQPKP